MSLYANSKSQKGKTYSPNDFNPYYGSDSESETPKTKNDVKKLYDSMKSF